MIQTPTANRVLTPYEQNLLLECGLDPFAIQSEIEKHGEKPVEYITGKARFKSRLFSVNSNTLIPRVESEELVDLALESVKQFLKHTQSSSLNIVDIGTGSGALGISLSLVLAELHPDLHQTLWLSDVSQTALDVVHENVNRFLHDKQMVDTKVVCSSVFDEFPQNTVFDIVLANLPYIPSERVAYLEASVKEFEPHVALDGGPQGFDLIVALLTQLQQFLQPKGVAWLEVDHTHTSLDMTKALPNTLSQKLSLTHFKDSFGQPRFFKVQFQ